jgi:anti-anti-sigma factor
MEALPLFAVVDRRADGVTLRLEGEVDLATADVLRGVLDATRPATGTFVLDVSDIEFMDSCGMHILLAEQQAAHDAGHRLVVSGAHGEVRRALRATGVDAVVCLLPDDRAASA